MISLEAFLEGRRRTVSSQTVSLLGLDSEPGATFFRALGCIKYARIQARLTKRMAESLVELLEWEAQQGGYEAPAWARAREVLNEYRDINAQGEST